MWLSSQNQGCSGKSQKRSRLTKGQMGRSLADVFPSSLFSGSSGFSEGRAERGRKRSEAIAPYEA